jgi:two-component system sensor histidine kinase DesK
MQPPRADAIAEPSHASPRRRRWALLPGANHFGWTPYAWLAYLAIFVAEPAAWLRAGTLTALDGAAVAVALAVFLVAYFRGHWVSGRRLLAIVAVHGALGVALAPVTMGAAVFFTYAASFAGNLDTTRAAGRAIVAVAATGATTLWLAGAPARIVVPAVAMTVLIGFVNMHYAEIRRVNARLCLAQEQVEQLAAVAERERIARDLHDVLGHTLSLVVLKADLAGRLVDRDPARAADEIRDVERVARDALREVREAIRGYRASLAEEVERSRSLLQAASIRAEVAVRLGGLPRPAEEALALALREGVTNVVRHARATWCRIDGVADDAHWTLTIEDDGAGRTAPEGAGLRGIRERIEALGGTVSQRTGDGMCLTLRLPREVVAAPSPRLGAGERLGRAPDRTRESVA